MTECITREGEKLSFNFGKKSKIEADFNGGDLSSDGGVLLLRELDERLGLFESFSSCINDPRNQLQITHPQVSLLRQRVFQICAGYEDVNDSSVLRQDPLFKTVCGQAPKSEQDLGSQPTLTRLENRITKRDISSLRRFFLERFLSRFDHSPKEIVLDIDGYADPTHGAQQLTFFHGYYSHYLYHPVLINDAETGFPIVLQLRAGNTHAGKGVKALLYWLFWRIRKVFPEVSITLRGDGGFSLPEIMAVCERSGVDYVLGYTSNNVLKRKNEYQLERARLQYIKTGEKARLFDDVYYQAASWDAPRRVIMKAEYMDQGVNQRFVVTNRLEDSQFLYDTFYVQRAEDSENRIKELKLDIKADRLSCHAFIANQFRLFLHQLAFVLMLELKNLAKGTPLENARCSTLRNALLKLAVRVRQSARRVWIQFASACPVKDMFIRIAHRISCRV